MLEKAYRELASRKESSGPVLSMYIDTNRNDEAQRDRIRLFLKNETTNIRQAVAGNGHDETAIDRGIRDIEQYVESELDPDTRGLAIFAAPEEQFFVPLQLPMTVEPQLTIGSRPNLRQLASIRRSHPLIAVAMVDGKSARLFELSFGRMLREIDLENPEVPRKHDQGGWSQANMQRHVQDHVDRHHKEVADTLAKLVDANRIAGVILSGQERNLANFRSQLPKRLEEKVIGTLHLDMHTPADAVAEACAGLVGTQREKELKQHLNEIEGLRRSGRGALGFGEVTDAANQRRIQHLFVTPTARARGWKCSACSTIGLSVPLGCPACGNGVVTIDLLDELIAAAHHEDAILDFSGPDSLLDQHDGIGALLRF